jgi:hypothetical protein
MTEATDRVTFVMEQMAKCVDDQTFFPVDELVQHSNATADPSLELVITAAAAISECARVLIAVYGREQALEHLRTVALGSQINSVFDDPTADIGDDG